MPTRKHKGASIIVLVIALLFITGMTGFVAARIHSTNYKAMQYSKIANQAHLFAMSAVAMAKATDWDNLDSLAENKKPMGSLTGNAADNDYKRTISVGAETASGDQKKRVVTVNVFYKTDNVPMSTYTLNMWTKYTF